VIGRIGPFARALDFVATAAPGVKEILTIGKIAWEVREAIAGRAEHDMVVVDAAATGHVVAQLGAADALHELVDVGPLRAQTRWVSDLVTDPAVTAVNVVTTPEEMPVAETVELVGRLRDEVRAPLGAVVANRVLPEPFTRADATVFAALVADPGRAALAARVGSGAVEAVEATRLAVAMRAASTEHLERLRGAVDLPVCYVPYLFVRAPGLRATRIVADALAEEFGVR
jgi:anion-transporting  ArsA/GET3 family ATPase